MATRIIAHRGYTVRSDGTFIRENTLEAFARALELGADGVELDVRRTADDVLVIHHDVHLEDGRSVRATLSDDLPPYVPTLTDALDVCSDGWTNTEIKNLPADPDYDNQFGISLAVAGLVQAFDASHRVLVSSFDFDSVQRIRQHSPDIPIGWLVWGQADPSQIVDRAHGAVDAVHAADVLVDRHFLRMARDAELDLNVWTVNDPDRLLELHAMRVQGIITDEVQMARDVLYGR